MSEEILICCNKPIEKGSVWILKDIANFTARKIYIGQCAICGDYAVSLIEKRISDNKIFVNNLIGIEAVKTIYREKKRLITKYEDIKSDFVSGWIYGVNKEIKNKKGQVTQIRQYASDVATSKKLGCTKTIYCK